MELLGLTFSDYLSRYTTLTDVALMGIGNSQMQVETKNNTFAFGPDR